MFYARKKKSNKKNVKNALMSNYSFSFINMLQNYELIMFMSILENSRMRINLQNWFAEGK